MNRDDKHALFAAAALNALIITELTKPHGEVSNEAVVVDAAWFADKLIREVEKK